MNLKEKRRARVGPNDYRRTKDARKQEDIALVAMCLLILGTLVYMLTSL